MVDQSLIEAEITELRAAQKNFTQIEIKENFDNILLDIANDVHALYDVYEEEYGKSVIESFFQYIIDTKEITDLDNAGKIIASYFKVFDKFFLSLAQSRKSRAGKTFENIHNTLFKMLKYPFDEHIVINGKPDFLMPSAQHYNRNPMECIIFTAKHSVKERWRQIVTEGTRGLGFYLATLDKKVSKIQLREMLKNRIYLVVPHQIKADYYSETINVLSFKEFFEDHLDPKVRIWKRNGII